MRYQIKGRRIHRRNKWQQLFAIRDLNGFYALAVVLFDDGKITWVEFTPAGTI